VVETVGDGEDDDEDEDEDEDEDDYEGSSYDEDEENDGLEEADESGDEDEDALRLDALNGKDNKIDDGASDDDARDEDEDGGEDKPVSDADSEVAAGPNPEPELQSVSGSRPEGTAAATENALHGGAEIELGGLEDFGEDEDWQSIGSGASHDGAVTDTDPTSLPSASGRAPKPPERSSRATGSFPQPMVRPRRMARQQLRPRRHDRQRPPLDINAIRRSFREQFRSIDARRRVLTWDPWLLDGASGITALFVPWIPAAGASAPGNSGSARLLPMAVPEGTWFGEQGRDRAAEQAPPTLPPRW